MATSVRTGLLCDYVITSQDGSLSLVHIFSDLGFTTFPGTYPRFFVVFILSLDQGQHQVQVAILDPAGTPLLSDVQPAALDVELPGAESNLVMDLNNFAFPRPGIYQVQLLVDGRLAHSMTLRVHNVEEQLAPARA